MSYDKLVALGKDEEFTKKVDSVYNEFTAYMNEPTDTKRPSIAYFSMEYGLSEILKIYSGGLGVLAGDYLKEASDSNIDMTAIGFLYRYGYFKQSLSIDGQQISMYEPQNFNILPIKQVLDEQNLAFVVEVPYPGRTVYAHLWKVSVGRVALYLLDTDIFCKSLAFSTLLSRSSACRSETSSGIISCSCSNPLLSAASILPFNGE